MKPDCGEGLTFTQPSLCKPEFAAECDLKGIVARFLKTGQLPDARESSGFDATQFPSDYQDLQNSIAYTRQRFDRLPFEVRNRYNNDPEAWLADVAAHAKKPPEPKPPEPKPPEPKPPEPKPPEPKP